MNIDLRKVERRTEEGVNFIKEKYRIATNTEAAQYAIKTHESNIKAIEHWKARALQAERQLEHIKETWQTLQSALK